MEQGTGAALVARRLAAPPTRLVHRGQKVTLPTTVSIAHRERPWNRPSRERTQGHTGCTWHTPPPLTESANPSEGQTTWEYPHQVPGLRFLQQGKAETEGRATPNDGVSPRRYSLRNVHPQAQCPLHSLPGKIGRLLLTLTMDANAHDSVPNG